MKVSHCFETAYSHLARRRGPRPAARRHGDRTEHHLPGRAAHGLVGHLEGGLAAARREAGTDRAAAQGQGQGMTRISMLTTAEAAARLDVSQRTLIRWRQSVPIIGPPPIRIGNGIRYAEADVNSWILTQREKGKS